MTTLDKVFEEAAWLKDHPEFEERPATLVEFLGPDYLDIESTTRARIRDELQKMFGKEVNPEKPTKVQKAIFTGAIGVGKTTVAAIVLTYLVHWVSCLKDPQKFFNLMPGSRIAFMMMSTSERQALEVVFGDVKARIEHSPWFRKHPVQDNNGRKRTKQFRFPKDIWIIPGDSQETTFEGYNILGGVLDEADSHKVTERKDYAEVGWETIYMRMASRFQDKGFAIVVGQMKSSTGFAARKYAEFKRDPDAHATKLTIWESMGDEFYKCPKIGGHRFNRNNPKNKVCGQVHKFPFDTLRKILVPPVVARSGNAENIMWIPETYRDQFETNPEKALKDLAGIPPAVGSPFISLIHKIISCRERWVDSYGEESPVRFDGQTIEPWATCKESIRRAAHIDIAYADEGDALGIAVGHVREVVKIDGEWKPYIVFDLLARFMAPPGGEIFLQDVRHWIYSLRDHFKYKLVQVTLDGFQSQDTIQQLEKRRYYADYLSVDREMLPYHDLREAIYEERIEFPPLIVKRRVGDTEKTEIAIKELSELIDDGKKIDHPEGGSKDVADAMAAVTCVLMGDLSYRRGRKKRRGAGENKNPFADDGSSTRGKDSMGSVIRFPGNGSYFGDPGLGAPLPPSGTAGGSYGAPIPPTGDFR